MRLFLRVKLDLTASKGKQRTACTTYRAPLPPSKAVRGFLLPAGAVRHRSTSVEILECSAAHIFDIVPARLCTARHSIASFVGKFQGHFISDSLPSNRKTTQSLSRTNWIVMNQNPDSNDSRHPSENPRCRSVNLPDKHKQRAQIEEHVLTSADYLTHMVGLMVYYSQD